MPLLSRLAVQASRAYGMLAAGSATNVSADYLVVAGGGGSGADVGGGGGAGGFRTSTATLSTLNTYSIAVGAGGNGGIYSSATAATAGNNSVISGTGLTTITSTGGGIGGIVNTSGGNGGSGGGGGGGGGSTTSGGTGTSGQGNNGGSGAGGSNFGAGGGGGASAVGASRVTTTGGNGGAGTASSISGSSVTYAGGGGGGAVGAVGATPGTGGAGGGGNGSAGGAGTAGTTNTGGGAGGGGNGKDGAAGGSGIVIISYTSATPKFVGGTITTSGGKQIHTFTSSGTLSPITPITASYLVVAGGGSGGAFVSAVANGGGGGAGGLLASSTTLYSGATYVVTVGAGGAGTAGTGANGSNSVLSGTGITTITSTGGGGGGHNGNGQAGGSGGGGGGNSAGTTGGAGTSGQGNNGGTSIAGSFTSGGGGGAGAVGGNSTSSASGNGGNGSASSISGSSVTYAGGGGGTGLGPGTGGTGGGGSGVLASAGMPGTANTGGGGGGSAGGPNVNGGAGGSGIVIISYAGSQQFNGGLVTSSGGNTIHTFTSTGALTPLTNNLTNSLRFRKSASAFLSRTPTSTGSQQIFTLSTWVKLGSFATGADSFIWASADNAVSGVNPSLLWKTFDGTYTFIFDLGTGGLLRTTQVFRDPSAWYHIVINADTTQATAANRMKMYINGNQVTAFSSATYPTQNTNMLINTPSHPARIGGVLLSSSTDRFFDGYMDDIYFVDGQALEPYFFGNNDANGVWKPIQYRGTYGTNGFYLNFSNTTSTTTLGFDSSPNGNNWTTNNISLTAGVTYDAMTDVPTNTSATVANYCVMNPLNSFSTITVNNANLQLTLNEAAYRKSIATMAFPTSGLYYLEGVVSGGIDYVSYGIVTPEAPLNNAVGSTATGYGAITGSTQWDRVNNGTQSGNFWNITTTNPTLQIAIDTTNGKLWLGYNNNWLDSSGGLTGNPSTGANATFTIDTARIYLPSFGGYKANSIVINTNFGQRPFVYTPPSGFVALNTFNLPTPTILQGNRYMDATLYTGQGVVQTVVNAGQFRPDFVWQKPRSEVASHRLVDSVRGVNNVIYSNQTAAQSTETTTLTAFNSNGFTGGGSNAVTSGNTAVAWQWQAGQGSTSSNTSGSITTTTSVNTTAGFSIIQFTGTQANATIGHGLGAVPRMVIVKTYGGGTRGWRVYHASIGNTGYLILNDTSATTTDSTAWNNTTPTSTVISLGANGETNNGGSLMIAYAWAEIAGFSRFGSYTGNGSADGPFVYTGFRPKYILVKITSTTDSWAIHDTSRSPYNTSLEELYPNLTNAESTGASNAMDILSNGFKLRGTSNNTNGATFIYAAFAENPFKNANAR